MVHPAPKIPVSERQRAILEDLKRSGKTSQRIAQRARIVLMSSDGVSNREQARRLSVDHQRVRRWRKRWLDAYPSLLEAEEKEATDDALEESLLKALGDNYRSGTPSKFSAEQITQLIALACELPEDSGLPISHWTPPDLAREAVKRGIVESISPRHLDRFLKGGERQAPPHPLLAQSKGG